MATSIKELLKASAAAAKSSQEARAELDKRLDNASKEIDGMACSFSPFAGGLNVILADNKEPGSNIEVSAETFSLICGWFGKHYIGGVMDENGKPETEEEA